MMFQFLFVFILFSNVLSQSTEIYEITGLPTSNPSLINNEIQMLSDELYRLNNKIDILFTSVSNDSSLYQQVLALSIKTNKLLNSELVDLKNRATNATAKYNDLTPTLSYYIKKVQCLSNSGCIPTPSTISTTPLTTTTLTSINDTLSCDKMKVNDEEISNDKIEEVNCNWNIISKIGYKYNFSLNSFTVQGNANFIIHDNINNNDVIALNKSIVNPITINSNGYNYTISVNSQDSISGVKFDIGYKKFNVCDVDTCANNGTCVVSPENTPKCTCSGCWMSSSNCQVKFDPCSTYVKCKTVDADNNPTGNTCKTVETSTSCTAKCYCKDSQNGTAFCR
uniref:EGF-like domain-containing protein n=1 Tax=Strongyloides venezuelensis TaxID=75913 RepID=A0A0K0FL53_STRVS